MTNLELDIYYLDLLYKNIPKWEHLLPSKVSANLNHYCVTRHLHPSVLNKMTEKELLLIEGIGKKAVAQIVDARRAV